LSLLALGGMYVMPVINIQLVGSLSEEQKAEIADRFTNLSFALN